MGFRPLKERIVTLPLILAGPIVRRAEPKAVSVWLALQEPRTVTLRVGPDEYFVSSRFRSSATPTIRLGKNLHLAMVTATPEDDSSLQWGQTYYYNLEFSDGITIDLESLSVLDPVTPEAGWIPTKLTYREGRIPSFVLPPSEIASLRLVHGSCRKPHDPGRDALAILDLLLDKHLGSDDPAERAERAHQLFLTGDQIYAEEVMDPLLWLVMDAADALVGWPEVPPLVDTTRTKELFPGGRDDLMRTEAGFRTHSGGQRRSHVVTLGEYAAMYLLVWSPVLWPTEMPMAASVKGYLKSLPRRSDAQKLLLTSLEGPKAAKAWDEQCRALEEFKKDLWRVRRALANVSTYMTFDDHDVTDDWYLNREWSANVLKKPLGRYIIENALIAYSLFQAWGNDPNQFTRRREFFDAVREWPETGPDEAQRRLLRPLLGMPQADFALDEYPFMTMDPQSDDYLVLARGNQSLDWHYTVRGPKHEVIVLDTRTWRGYPPKKGAERDPATLLSPSAFANQFAQPRGAEPEVTFVIAQTNPIGIWVIDFLQANVKTIDELMIEFGIGVRRDPLEPGVTYLDYGDAWNFNQFAFATLLSKLFSGSRRRVVVLSGDIHFGYAVRVSYWASEPFAGDIPAEAIRGVMAQLTSSAFKNADGLKKLTKLIHTKAKLLAIAEVEQNWAGWKDPATIWVATKYGPNGLPIPPWWTKYKPASESPLVIWLDEDDDDKYYLESVEEQPGWRYRIAFIKKVAGDAANRPRVFVTAPTENERKLYLEKFRDALKVDPQAVFADPKFQGPELVGLHNIGVVRYEPEPIDKPSVYQDLYFWPYGNPQDHQYYKDTYTVSLAIDQPPRPLPPK